MNGSEGSTRRGVGTQNGEQVAAAGRGGEDVDADTVRQEREAGELESILGIPAATPAQPDAHDEEKASLPP